MSIFFSFECKTKFGIWKIITNNSRQCQNLESPQTQYFNIIAQIIPDLRHHSTGEYKIYLIEPNTYVCTLKHTNRENYRYRYLSSLSAQNDKRGKLFSIEQWSVFTQYCVIPKLYLHLFRSRSYHDLAKLNHTVKIDVERTRGFVNNLRRPFDNRPFSVKYYYKWKQKLVKY